MFRAWVRTPDGTLFTVGSEEQEPSQQDVQAFVGGCRMIDDWYAAVIYISA